MPLGCRDAERAPFGHRVPRIHAKVEERHLDLVVIGARGRQPFRHLDHQADFRPDRRSDQFGHAAYQRADFDRAELQRLLPREGQEPLYERPRPLGRLHGTLDKAALALRAKSAAPQDVQPAHDRRQQVVEVVGDAA
ncbi:hypothetical protein LTR94_031236, partial [Friedmanniomyces endolithicus]